MRRTFTAFISFYQGQWHRDRIKYDIILLSDAQREAVDKEIERLCEFRHWKLWKANPRSNHVHVVVTALGYSGEKVRDLLNLLSHFTDFFEGVEECSCWSVAKVPVEVA